MTRRIPAAEVADRDSHGARRRWLLPGSRPAAWLILWLPVLVGAALTLPFLQRSPLWADEADSLSAALRPSRALWVLLRHQDGPLGPYYLFLHLWVRAVGQSTWLLRLPSALAFLAAVALTTLIGRRLGGPAVGLFAGGLLASNPFALFFALDARPYAIAILAACGAGWALVAAADPPSRLRQLAYGGSLLLGMLAHLFFLFVVAAQLLGLHRSRRPVRPWLLPAAGVLVLVSPLVVLSSGHSADVGYLRSPGLLTALGWFQAMAGGKGWLAAPVGVVIVLAAARRPRPLPLLMWWLLLPGPVLLLVSLLHPLYLGRYVVESVPALSLLVALAIGLAGRSRPGTAVAVAATLFTVSCITAVATQSAPFRYEDARGAADFVLDGTRAGDAVVFLPVSVRTVLDVYLAREDLTAPRPTDVLLAPVGGENAVGNFGGRQQPAAVAVQALLRHRVVWAVTYAARSAHEGATAVAVLRNLSRCYRAGVAHRFGLLVVRRERDTGRCTPDPSMATT